PARYGMPELAGLIEYGASPRASIGMVQAAQALALLRGRAHVTPTDVRDLAPDVLRHRLVISYDGLADGVQPDTLLEQVIGAVHQSAAFGGPRA
ncbi:hypothetical protein PXW65_25475, partial [Klebsiella quasipneumoniae subsp. similipneumoniae]|uniref:AAA family ATPase n=1 Tax=Klebsiella quasipneumoniae TaxID=1463165 RepID=UPI003C12B8FF|nr:hypothetical protein [Klebsiella quasipneumoniae subsp. similipneumoniae]